jgi:hypothetical protein
MSATFYKLLGHDVRSVFLWQMLVSMSGNVLVYILARRYFGDMVTVLAAALVVLCGPLLYYDMVLLRESMIGPAGSLLAYLMERARDRPTKRRWMVLESAFGFVILLKSYLLLMLAVMLGFLVTTQRRTPQALAARAGALVGAVLVALSPAVLRNVVVGTDPFRLSSVGPITFVCDNTPDYPADAGILISERYTPGIMARAEGRLLPCVIKTLRSDDNPLGYVGKSAAKFAAIWHWYETPNNANFYYYRLHASLWTGRPLPKGREMIRVFDYITPYTVDWTAKINDADSTGNHAQAVALLERSLRFEPGSVRHIGPLRHAGTADEMELAAFYTRIQKAYGQALAKAGRSQEAQTQFRRVEELTAATAP